MDNKDILARILLKEGAADALKELSVRYDMSDRAQIRNKWVEIERLLLNFRLKRYSITGDFLLSEITLHPFKTHRELEDLKKYLLN